MLLQIRLKVKITVVGELSFSMYISEVPQPLFFSSFMLPKRVKQCSIEEKIPYPFSKNGQRIY